MNENYYAMKTVAEQRQRQIRQEARWFTTGRRAIRARKSNNEKT